MILNRRNLLKLIDNVHDDLDTMEVLLRELKQNREVVFEDYDFYVKNKSKLNKSLDDLEEFLGNSLKSR